MLRSPARRDPATTGDGGTSPFGAPRPVPPLSSVFSPAPGDAEGCCRSLSRSRTAPRDPPRCTGVIRQPTPGKELVIAEPIPGYRHQALGAVALGGVIDHLECVCPNQPVRALVHRRGRRAAWVATGGTETSSERRLGRALDRRWAVPSRFPRLPSRRGCRRTTGLAR